VNVGVELLKFRWMHIWTPVNISWFNWAQID